MVTNGETIVARRAEIEPSYVGAPTVIEAYGLCLGDNLSTDQENQEGGINFDFSQ